MAESGKSTDAKQPWVRPSWPDFEGATVTVTHLIYPQGVGSEGKQQALVRLPMFVWELGTSKGHIACLRLLRVDFYKDQVATN